MIRVPAVPLLIQAPANSLRKAEDGLSACVLATFVGGLDEAPGSGLTQPSAGSFNYLRKWKKSVSLPLSVTLTVLWIWWNQKNVSKRWDTANTP